MHMDRQPRSRRSSESERVVKPGYRLSRSNSEAELEKLKGEFEELVASDEDDSAPSISSNGSDYRKLGPKDFELLRVVGQGAFGKVFQVRLKNTTEVYAMKVMSLSFIVEQVHLFMTFYSIGAKKVQDP